MAISQYIGEYRRAADGHRYNNNDLFSLALDYYVEQHHNKWFDFQDEFEMDDDMEY